MAAFARIAAGAAVGALALTALPTRTLAFANTETEEERMSRVLQSALEKHGGDVNRCFEKALADTVDVGMLTRRLRMAAVWAGPCRIGAFKAGDGTASAAAELVGEHATITLALVIDPETRILRLADVAP